MVYLIIMFSVAAVGIGTLWVQQKRERSHLESSEKFLSSLQKISPEVQPVQRRRRRAAAPQGRKRSAGKAPARRPSKAEIARRQAARRRVEARRRAAAGAGRSRAVS